MIAGIDSNLLTVPVWTLEQWCTGHDSNDCPKFIVPGSASHISHWLRIGLMINFRLMTRVIRSTLQGDGELWLGLGLTAWLSWDLAGERWWNKESGKRELKSLKTGRRICSSILWARWRRVTHLWQSHWSLTYDVHKSEPVHIWSYLGGRGWRRSILPKWLLREEGLSQWTAIHPSLPGWPQWATKKKKTKRHESGNADLLGGGKG